MEKNFTRLGKLRMGDWELGLLIAVISAVLTVAYESVSTGTLNFNWKNMLAVGLTAGISYILKNLGTGAGGKLLSNEQPKLELPKGGTTNEKKS